MRSIFYGMGVVVTILSFVSCSKSNGHPLPKPIITDSTADFTSFTIKGMNPQISFAQQSVNLRFPDSVTNAKSLVASFTLTPGIEAFVNGAKQVSDVSTNNFESTLYYTLTNAQGFSKRWVVWSTNNNYSYSWGLGNFVKQSLSNDRSYKWYYNQSGTGPYSDINCGPTCTAMAMKWADSTDTGTPQQVRDYYPQNTGEWGLHAIGDYLADHNFPHYEVTLGDSAEKTKQVLKAELDKGHILILLLSMSNLRPYNGASYDPRVDRYYPEGFNHFLVVYGYKEVDDEFYFQTNDPWGAYTNKDGTLKEIGHFYRYEDIWAGCFDLGNTALVLSKK